MTGSNGHASGNGNGHGEAQLSELAPFDLDAAIAAAAADNAPVPFNFTYNGHDYVIPAQSTWKMRTLAKLGRNDIEGCLTDLIGQESYDQLLDDGLTVAGLNALFEQIAESAGTGDLGNSQRSRGRVSTRT